MNNEQREFVRHQLKPKAIFLHSNYSPVGGWVKDISKRGMAFEYFTNSECEPRPEIRLILIGKEIPFYLPDIPCKTIYDINVPSKAIEIRRCGVQFVKLNKKMQENLAFLLSSEVNMRNSEV